MRTVSPDGTSIAYYDFGGTGRDVLLGHATGFCAHVWRPVVELLKPYFHCYAYDLRGHGESESPEYEAKSAWDWHRYAADAGAVVEAAGLTDPISVGHSCGAGTALLLEEASAGTFAAIIGFEPVMFAYDPPLGPDYERDLAIKTRKRRTKFASAADAIEVFSTRGPFVDIHPDALAAYVEHGFAEAPDGTIALRCDPEDEANVYIMATAHRGFVELGNVSPPVTVVRGSESTSFDEPTMRAVAERVRQGTFVGLEGVGHFGALEDPERFARIVFDATSAFVDH